MVIKDEHNTCWAVLLFITRFAKAPSVINRIWFILFYLCFFYAWVYSIVLNYELNTGLLKMIVGVLTTCHTQYTWDRSICMFFYLIEQHSKFLLHTLQVLYMFTLCNSTNINTIIEFVPHKTPSHCRSPPS